TLAWSTLVKPFVEYQPLKDHVGNVETVVMRLANLVAKCDGLTTPEESLILHRIHHDLTLALGGTPRPLHRPIAPDEELPLQADGRSAHGTFGSNETRPGSASNASKSAQ